jgi:hypothetical protein
MELEPEKLNLLNVQEADLETMLFKIQEAMDEEDERLAATFAPKSEFDRKAGNTVERIEVKGILKELGLERKYHQNFTKAGVDTV